jgi:pimeloyl-ACP methyl ester carboxylesterase
MVVRASIFVVASLALALVGCGSSSDSVASAPDAGASPDAAPVGTGTPDAAPPPAVDSGAADAMSDSAPTEAGPMPRADLPGVPCSDTIADVYVTPTGLPPMDDGHRGDIVRCAEDFALEQSAAQAEVTAKGIAMTATTGVTIYRVAFRTMRSTGLPGVSTARVYLPHVPLALPIPLIDAAHPTNGLASSCAPSKDSTSNEDLALPWAALGYPVIVPDYAGLGNDDPVQGYLDNHDTAYSTLDGARALRKLMTPGVFSDSVLLVGYSQGGGAALSAQALARTYGLDGTLVGIVVFAPEWPTRLNSFGYVDMLNNPTELTVETGISDSTVYVMRQYAYYGLFQGAANAAVSFPSGEQSDISSAVTSLCETPLGGVIQGAYTHLGDLIDPTLRSTLVDCIDGATCVDPGKTYFDFLQQNFVTADPNGPPILYVQGLADPIMPPASEAACNIAKLQADGVSPQVCTDLEAIHTNVVGRNMAFALQWAQALLGGDALPACPSSSGMPACTP